MNVYVTVTQIFFLHLLRIAYFATVRLRQTKLWKNGTCNGLGVLHYLTITTEEKNYVWNKPLLENFCFGSSFYCQGA